MIIDKTVVLVEDSPEDAELIKRAIEKSGFQGEFKWFSNGPDALNYLSLKKDLAKLSVVILDYKMDGLSGKDVLKQIRTNPISKNLPVVMLTSSDESSDVEECYGLGVNSYVVKPNHFSQFKSVISHLSEYWVGINRAPNVG
ncbi:response regulator [Luteibaculum oceani]|uniref:Response regulator n=1 Tax=Luteibaculum oceani TaxID=1294296 RepID=A0A5C6VNS9_9FLAO|nr:response regulator [Luteibaculum oceani]TXC85315.1 response regulator [Luteibaculum oceani]